MQIRFPKDPVAWNNYVERLLAELRTDFDRFWQVFPQIPDPEAGVPSAGPLDPGHIKLLPQEGSGSASALTAGSASLVSGVFVPSGTAFGCPAMIVLSINDVNAGECVNCDALNGNFNIGLTGAFPGEDACDYSLGTASPVTCATQWLINVGYQFGYWTASITEYDSGRYALWQAAGLKFGTTTLLFQVATSTECTWPATVTVTST